MTYGQWNLNQRLECGEMPARFIFELELPLYDSNGAQYHSLKEITYAKEPTYFVMPNDIESLSYVMALAFYNLALAYGIQKPKNIDLKHNFTTSQINSNV